MSRILGLDLGTSTGYAMMANGKLVFSGAWDCSFRRNVDSPSVRMQKFADNLTAMLQLHDIDKVCYENIRRHNGIQAAHVYGALKSKMMEVCEAFDVVFEGVEVGHWKKALTGKGNASKDLVFQYVHSVFEYSFVREFDEADAIGIARYGTGLR